MLLTESVPLSALSPVAKIVIKGLWRVWGFTQFTIISKTIMFDRSVFIDAIWKHLTRESEITNNLSFPEIALASASALVYQCQSPHCHKENWRRLHLIKLNFFSMIFHHFLYREAAVFVIKPFLEKHGSSNVHLIVFVTFMGHKRVFERYFPVVTHLF